MFVDTLKFGAPPALSGTATGCALPASNALGVKHVNLASNQDSSPAVVFAKSNVTSGIVLVARVSYDVMLLGEYGPGA
jgi:hypothetical protein